MDLIDTGERDEYGMQPLDDLLSSPERGPSRANQQDDDDDYNLVMNVNLLGVWNCMRAELNNMKSGGSIVNASSAAGLIGFAGGAAYTASKHGVAGLTRSACKEFGSMNIRVNAVAS